jgi:thiamine-monophosphate kinase
MRVADVGEFGLISRLADLIEKRSDKKAASWKGLLIGIGDDAAAWKCQNGVELITTDVLVEGTHFDLSYMGWRDLGWKSMAINVSDIYAMGGRPEYALVSLALPGSHKTSDILKMYEGMMEACNAYGIAIAGGNVSASTKIVINVTLTGTAVKNVMKRSTASSGDLIAVFGYPGLSASGLKISKLQLPVVSSPARKLFLGAHLHPAPQLNSGPSLAACGVKTAIDTSDGLLSDLSHICEASRSGAVIYEQSMPVHPLLKRYFKRDFMDMVLTGGEDYELLFTADCDTMRKVQQSMKPAPSIIGEITAGKKGAITVLDPQGKPVEYGHKGWDHYKGLPGNG